jgi:hypothetical protein
MAPVIVEGDRLWDLLRSLDDPRHVEWPKHFNRRETRKRFGQLVNRLDAAFSCACEAWGDVQDASFHDRVEIPRRPRQPGCGW